MRLGQTWDLEGALGWGWVGAGLGLVWGWAGTGLGSGRDTEVRTGNWQVHQGLGWDLAGALRLGLGWELAGALRLGLGSGRCTEVRTGIWQVH